MAVLCAAGSLRVAAAADNACATPAGPVAIGAAQWNGWGRDLENTRYQPEPALRCDVTWLLQFEDQAAEAVAEAGPA